MRKLLQVFFLFALGFSLLLLVQGNKTYADFTTSWESPTHIYCTGWTNCNISNLYENNTSTPITFVGSGANDFRFGGYSFSIPSGSTIESVEYIEQMNLSNYANFQNIILNNGDNYYSSNITTESGLYLYSYNQAVSSSFNISIFNSTPYFTPGAGSIYSDITPFGSGDSISWIQTRLHYTYGNPLASIASVDTSATTSGKIKVDLSGDTGITATNEACVIYVVERNTTTTPPTPFINSQVEITVSALSPLTESQDLGNNQYLGAGYSSSSANWFANNVQFPYYPNINTDFTTSYSCYHSITNSDGSESLVLDSTESGLGTTVNGVNATFDPTLDATPSATQQFDGIGDNTTCNPASDVFGIQVGYLECSFQDALTSWFNSTFGLDPYSIQSNTASIVYNLDQKVPFAYFDAVAGLNFSGMTEASSAGDINISFRDAGNSYVSTAIPSGISWSPTNDTNSWVQQIAGVFKNLVATILILPFMLYIYSRIKDIFF